MQPVEVIQPPSCNICHEEAAYLLSWGEYCQQCYEKDVVGLEESKTLNTDPHYCINCLVNTVPYRGAVCACCLQDGYGGYSPYTPPHPHRRVCRLCARYFMRAIPDTLCRDCCRLGRNAYIRINRNIMLVKKHMTRRLHVWTRVNEDEVPYDYYCLECWKS